MDFILKLAVTYVTIDLLAAAEDLQGGNALYLTSHVSRSRVQHGENLVYHFSIVINDTENFLTVVFNGLNLHVPEDANVSNLTDFDEFESTTTLEDDFYVGFKSRDTDSFTVNVNLTLVRYTHMPRILSGNINFQVEATAPLGSILRPVMFIDRHKDDENPSSTYIVGDYVFLSTPSLSISAGSPHAIDMKDTSEIEAKILYPTGPVEPTFLRMFMPNNVSTTKASADMYVGEPFLHAVISKYISQTDVQESVDLQSSIDNPTTESFSKTSENDVMMMTLPQLMISPNIIHNNSAEIKFAVNVEGMDFFGSVNERQLVVGFVLELPASGFFIVQPTSLVVERKHDVIVEKPLLDHTLELSKVDDTGENPELQFVISLWHHENSWGSAYDVELVLYKPAFLTNVDVKRSKDVIRSNKKLSETVNDHIVTFKLERMSFPHNVKIQFTATIDVVHVDYVRNHSYDVILDVIYKGWKDNTEYGDMTSTTLSFTTTEEQHDLPCDCLSHDSSTCKCPGEDVDMCTKDLPPWMCNTPVQAAEMGGETVLDDRHGTVYRCRQMLARRNAYRKVMSCSVETTVNGKTSWKKFPPIVHALIGMSRQSHDLFAFSRHGLAFVTSQDGGTTWYSVDPGVMAKAVRSTDFLHANSV